MLKQQRAISIPEDTVKVILKIIQQANEPIAAEKIQQQLPGPFRIDNAELLNRILNEQAKTGNIHRWLLFNSKKRFWVHEPQEYIKNKILEIIQQTNEPLTAEKIQQHLPVPFRVDMKFINKILNEQIRIGAISEWLPKKKKRFWSRNLEEYTSKKILEILAEKRLMLSELDNEIRKSLFGCSEDNAKKIRIEFLKKFLQNKQVVKHPKADRETKNRYSSNPPDPARYIKSVEKEFKKVCDILKEYDISCEQVFQAITDKLMPSFEKSGTDDENQPSSLEPSQKHYKMILDKIIEIEPAARRQALVSIPDLRIALDLPKQVFDQAILNLASQEKIFLHRHVHPGRMSQEERNQMVADGQGDYYMGVVLRN
ncbi:MAG: hypothetical protein GY795_06170 [Desulfobacterales bacterium]|nr:hypothetical protein [Desulfobacterales bacterium]